MWFIKEKRECEQYNEQWQWIEIERSWGIKRWNQRFSKSIEYEYSRRVVFSSIKLGYGIK